MTTNPPPILVAGIGNILMGDDGFGVEVARQLASRSSRQNVNVVDFGIRGFDLALALSNGPRAAILIDAAQRGNPPGTITVLDPLRNSWLAKHSSEAGGAPGNSWLAKHSDEEGSAPGNSWLAKHSDEEGSPPGNSWLAKHSDEEGSPPGNGWLAKHSSEEGSPPGNGWLAKHSSEEGAGPGNGWLAKHSSEEGSGPGNGWLAKHSSEEESAPENGWLAKHSVEEGSGPGNGWLAKQSSEVARVRPAPARAIDTHGMHPVRALELARSMGGVPPHIRIVVCEPHTLGSEDEPVMGLSPAVANAIANAVAIVDSLLAELAVDA